MSEAEPPEPRLVLFVEDRALRLWERIWAERVADELFAVLAANDFARDTARAFLCSAFFAPSGKDVLERLTETLGRAPATLP